MKKYLVVSLILLLISSLFYILYHFDNKYKSGEPYGNHGKFIIEKIQDGKRKPMQLIDDWIFYKDELLMPKQTSSQEGKSIFIGQYPNFSFFGNEVSYGTYQMEVVINSDQVYGMKIPEIFSEYQLYINGEVKVHHVGDILPLQKGSNEILVQVLSSNHYYSGMVYPITLGTIPVLTNLQRVHDGVYLLFIILSFSIACFTLMLRKHEQNKMYHSFGMLSLCFAIHSLYPFLHDLSSIRLWYVIEDGSFMLMIYYLALLCASMSQIYDKSHKIIRWIGGTMVLCSMIIPSFILPSHQNLVTFYGYFIDLYKIGISMYLFYCARKMFQKKHSHAIGVLACGGIFALSLLCNLLFNNLYEPIYTAWQSEYAMLFMILLFFYIINRLFAETLEEHQHLTHHLKEEVDLATKEMSILLEERKAFFSQVAHDLKAPLSAIHNYTQLIERNDLYVDSEISSYLQSIDRKNQELLQRVSVLNEITKIDKLDKEKESVSINSLMKKVYEDNVPESHALGIYFKVHTLEKDVCVFGVFEKLQIVFENLFYNSLTFTPPQGTIDFSAKVQENQVTLIFKDDGEGIAQEHLPFVFDRFYSVRKKRSEESGLGLYIVKMIVTEMGGATSIESELGKGTTIRLKFPILS